MDSGIVKTLINRKTIITVKGEKFIWNHSYRCYNSERNSRRLLWSDLGVQTGKTGTPVRKRKHTSSGLIKWKW